MKDFLLAVLTTPGFFPAEAEYLEGLLAAGLEKLHIRKPGAGRRELESLVEALPERFHSRLVMHGADAVPIAIQYGIPQVHGAIRFRDGDGLSGGGTPLHFADGLALSTSLHSHEEMKRLPEGIAYAFISPLFDSISKPGYMASGGLLRRPFHDGPCPAIGMGGVSGSTIGQLIEYGWDGAAVLGWIWERPEQALTRYDQLMQIVRYGKRG